MKATKTTINKLVDAFLAWPLPESVCSDICATKKGYPNRSGTNLLTADEARKMFEHVLKATRTPSPRKNKEWPKWFRSFSTGALWRFDSSRNGIYISSFDQKESEAVHHMGDMLDGSFARPITSRQAAEIRRGWRANK